MQNQVVWREGLFIRPQHFQQNDRYYNYELMTRSLYSRENSWGLFNLSFDESLLNTGKISIKHVSGIMPDGTLFDVSSKNQLLTFDVNHTHSNKVIYLALPIFIEDGDSVHFEDQKKLLTRYTAKVANNIPNTNAGELSNSDILLAQQNFKLVTEDDLNDSFISIEIAKIGNISTSGIVSLEEDFVPTYLHLNNSTRLLSQIKDLLSMISYRANVIADNISDSRLQSTELGNYLMLQLLNRTESRLHYFLTQDRVHPDKVFLELSSLVAELSVFMKKERRIAEYITYNHLEQFSSFLKIIDDLKSMLTMVLEQNSVALKIEKRKYGIYIAPIKDKKLLESSTFIFAVSADISENKIREALLSSLKLGTIETIKNLVNYHLVGFKLRTLSSAPKEIPYKVNYLYFSIELSEKNRKELLQSSGFAFYLPNDIPNINYSIWAITND